jgi:hypothetical protein
MPQVYAMKLDRQGMRIGRFRRLRLPSCLRTSERYTGTSVRRRDRCLDRTALNGGICQLDAAALHEDLARVRSRLG